MEARQYTYAPKVIETSQERSQRVEERLIQMGRLYNAKKEEAVNQTTQEFKKFMSKKSEQLLQSNSDFRLTLHHNDSKMILGDSHSFGTTETLQTAD